MEGSLKFSWEKSTLVIGSEYIYRGADYKNQYGKHHRNDYAAFLEAKKEFKDRLILTLGVRQQFINADEEGKDYPRFLPGLGGTYKASKSVNLFANVGKAFRSPTFNNLYYESSFLVGNPDLDPEEGWTYETGLKYDSQMIMLRLAAFYMTYKDKIEIDRSKGYPLTYFNAGEYETKGIEWEMSLSPFINQSGCLKYLTFHAAGFGADPIAEDTAGKEYQAGPKFQTELGLSYLADTSNFGLTWNTLREREKELDNTSVLNLFYKFEAYKGFFTIGIDNIFDEEVQVSGDLSANAANRYVYYDLGRMVKVGYELTFF